MEPNPFAKPTRIPDIIPAETPTLRVTETVVESDGGSFTLSLGEYRPIRPYTPDQRNADGNSAYVELARFALSPVTLAALKQAILNAESFHAKHFGPLPDVAQFKARLAAEGGPMIQPLPEEKRAGLRSA